MKKVIITLLALIFALAISAETTLAYPPPVLDDHPWGGESYLPVASPPFIKGDHPWGGEIYQPLMSPPIKGRVTMIGKQDVSIIGAIVRPLMSPPFIKGDHPWGGESYLPLTSPPRIKGDHPWDDIDF